MDRPPAGRGEVPGAVVGSCRHCGQAVYHLGTGGVAMGWKSTKTGSRYLATAGGRAIHGAGKGVASVCGGEV
jgi:hypothetical protein